MDQNMIEWIKKFIAIHPEAAPLAIIVSFLIGGLNLPVSADMVILIAATLAATILKGAFLKLYLCILIGTVLAAYLAYAQGRFFGSFLLKKKFFQKLFPEAKLLKMKNYYENYALLTLLIGRFIPFGFRNALFVSVGLAKVSFKKLASRDLIAAMVWSFTLYSVFYHLVISAHDILSKLKKFNLIIFSIVALAIITWVWYKQLKRRRVTT